MLLILASLVFADLRCEVVLQYTKVLNAVLNDKGLLIVKAKSSVGRKRRSLVKHVEVADCKLLRDTLVNLKKHAIFGRAALVATELDRATTSLAIYAELAEVWMSRDSHGLIQGVEFLANLTELTCVDAYT